MLTHIRSRLDGLFDHDEGIDTHTVKTALCRACLDFNAGLECYATGVVEGAAADKEFLYDVTGLRYDDERFLTRVALAAECEWGTQNDIFYDFEKLLLVRADLRVMVFDGRQQPGYQEIFQVLARYICRCTHTEADERWLFAAWTPEKFVYHIQDNWQ